MFGSGTKVMSKPIEDPLFLSTNDLTKYWGRFIDFLLLEGLMEA